MPEVFAGEAVMPQAVRVGRGWPNDGGAPFVAVMLIDETGDTMTLALPPEVAREVALQLAKTLGRSPFKE